MTAPPELPIGFSADYLVARLSLIESRIAASVGRRRGSRHRSEDRFRGLYISSEEVDELLSAPLGEPGLVLDPAVEEFGDRLAAVMDQIDDPAYEPRLLELESRLGLSALESDTLLAILAPDVDSRFERLYGFLLDDATQRRPTTGLILDLMGVAPHDARGRELFSRRGPLRRCGLVEIGAVDRPFLTRSLCVPDRVTAHLLGDDLPDHVLAPLLDSHPAASSLSGVEGLTRAVEHSRLVYVRCTREGTGFGLAAAAADRLAVPVLALNADRLEPGTDVDALAAACARETALTRALVAFGPLGAVSEPTAIRTLTSGTFPLVLVDAGAWDARWAADVPVVIDAVLPTTAERAGLWETALSDVANDLDEPAEATAHFRLSPSEIERAVTAASLTAQVGDRSLSAGDLQDGARSQNAAALERLARRISPRVGWDDLVLPDRAMRQLRELAQRALYREHVLDEWGMGAGTRRRGIIALFSGHPGTGKTMAAEAVASELGLDMYSINLATVVDKYIGETEKNLERIFGAAEGINGVLFFDEADALFGKRSEVKDARDRYANVEVAYLLQRLELFDGIAVLATNLKANVDEAFTRRIDVSVDFPLPQEVDRKRLWEAGLRPDVPRDGDLDLDYMAKAFELSGGSITNICVTAAYLAASHDESVSMRQLIWATQDEYRKLGRLRTEAEFGPYLELLSEIS